MLGNTLGTTKIQCLPLSPKTKRKKKGMDALGECYFTSLATRTFFCIIVFFAIFRRGY
jgi:hypothetical protein